MRRWHDREGFSGRAGFVAGETGRFPREENRPSRSLTQPRREVPYGDGDFGCARLCRSPGAAEEGWPRAHPREEEDTERYEVVGCSSFANDELAGR